MSTEKKARGNAMELILSVCSGLRKVPAKAPEDIAYYNALGDVFNYIIEHESAYLMPGTVLNGKWEQDHSSTIQSRLDRRKSRRRVAIEEGTDESDYYFCPTCYAIIGTHDEGAAERGSYRPDCGQKLTWQEYHEKQMQDRLKSLIHDGSLQVETKDGALFCCLMGGTPFVVEAPLPADDEYQMIHNIAITLMQPGAFGISREVMEKIRVLLWED